MSNDLLNPGQMPSQDFESANPPNSGQPKSLLLQFFAQVISVAFHPLFVGLLMATFVVYAHPSYFVGFDRTQRMHIMVIYFYNSVFFPIFVVLLLRGLKFISSIQLRTRRDRIIPYMASSVFFFWTFWVFQKQA